MLARSLFLYFTFIFRSLNRYLGTLLLLLSSSVTATVLLRHISQIVNLTREPESVIIIMFHCIGKCEVTVKLSFSL